MRSSLSRSELDSHRTARSGSGGSRHGVVHGQHREAPAGLLVLGQHRLQPAPPGCARRLTEGGVQPGLQDPAPVGDAGLLGDQLLPVGRAARPGRGGTGAGRAGAGASPGCGRGAAGRRPPARAPPVTECRGLVTPARSSGPATRLESRSPVRSSVPLTDRRLCAVTRSATTTRVAESPLARTRRARRIDQILAETYPDAHCELDFSTPLELVVATILSAQSTDVGVNKVTPALFAKYPTAADYAGADRAELEEMIHSTGFFRAKTNSLIGLGQALVERYGGEVPGRLADLVTLPGIGRKTANVVLGQRVRRAGHHRRHPLRPAGPAVRLDRAGRPGQGRDRGRRAVPEAGLDHAQPPGDLPRPPHLPRPQAGLRGLPGRPRSARRTARGSSTRSRRRSWSSRRPRWRRRRERRRCGRAGRRSSWLALRRAAGRLHRRHGARPRAGRAARPARVVRAAGVPAADPAATPVDGRAARPRAALPRRRTVGATSPTCAARRRCSTCGPPGAPTATARCRCSPTAMRAGRRPGAVLRRPLQGRREVRRAVRRRLRRAVPVGARRGRRRLRRAPAPTRRRRRCSSPPTAGSPAARSARSSRRASSTAWCGATSAYGCDVRGPRGPGVRRPARLAATARPGRSYTSDRSS